MKFALSGISSSIVFFFRLICITRAHLSSHVFFASQGLSRSALMVAAAHGRIPIMDLLLRCETPASLDMTDSVRLCQKFLSSSSHEFHTIDNTVFLPAPNTCLFHFDTIDSGCFVEYDRSVSVICSQYDILF